MPICIPVFTVVPIIYRFQNQPQVLVSETREDLVKLNSIVIGGVILGAVALSVHSQNAAPKPATGSSSLPTVVTLNCLSVH